MRARTRRTLTIWWICVIVGMLVPLALVPLVNLTGITSISWMIAMVLGFVTLKKSDRTAHLQRPGWYRIALWCQLAVSVVTAAAASQTVFTGGSYGFIASGSTAVVIAILTWRALTTPGPKAALWAASLATTVTFVMLMVDIMIEIRLNGLLSPLRHTPLSVTSILGAFLLGLMGPVVCLVVLRAFGEPTNLPDARAIDA